MTSPGLRMATGLSGDPARDRRWGARRLALEVAAIEAVRAFGAVGISSILLKGPVTAARLYPDTFRPYLDIDLLVPPDEHERAGTVLLGLGYVSAGAGVIASGFVRPLDGAQIDLHRTLFPVRATPQVVWRVLWAHRVPFALHRATVSALDDPALALHIALHFTQTGPAKPKPRQDLDRALSRFPTAIWEAAWRIGVELDAADAFAAALRCGPPAGNRLADRLGVPARVPLAFRALARHRSVGLRSAALLSRGTTAEPVRGTTAEAVRRWLFPTAAQRSERLRRPDAQHVLPNAWPGLRLVVLRSRQLAAMVRAVAVEAALSAPAAARRAAHRALPRRRRGSPP